MPNIYIGAKSRCTKQFLGEVLDAKGTNDHVFVGKSCWMTLAILCEVIEALSQSLQSASDRQVVLLMDCAKEHLSHDVIEQATHHNLWLAFAPAGLTAVLEPLDTSVFARYKANLRTLYQQYREKNETIARFDWMQIVFRAAQHKSNGNWKMAFEGCGLLGPTSQYSTALRRILGEQSLSIEGTLPFWHDLF